MDTFFEEVTTTTTSTSEHIDEAKQNEQQQQQQELHTEIINNQNIQIEGQEEVVAETILSSDALLQEPHQHNDVDQLANQSQMMHDNEVVMQSIEIDQQQVQHVEQQESNKEQQQHEMSVSLDQLSNAANHQLHQEQNDVTKMDSNENSQQVIEHLQQQQHQEQQIICSNDNIQLMGTDDNHQQHLVETTTETMTTTSTTTDLTNLNTIVAVTENHTEGISNSQLQTISNLEQSVIGELANSITSTTANGENVLIVVNNQENGQQQVNEAANLMHLANSTIIAEVNVNSQSEEANTEAALATSLGISTTNTPPEGENDDLSNHDMLDEDQNEASLKDIDDTLALSPNGFGITSNSFVMNGSNVSTHTFRKTEWDVKKLENYVKTAFGDLTPMEVMAPSLMNRYLKSFFELAKKSDGMDYEPESLIGFMNSFERYLKTKNYPESLLRSETFKESRTVLKKKRDLVRSIGKLIRTKTKDTCYLLQFHRNLLKEKGLLNRDNPDCLLAEIYLNNMIYFGEFLKEDKAWRGNLNLVWGDMLLERDSQTGQEYLTLATYAKKSNRQGNAPNQPQVNSSPGTTGRNNVRTRTGTQTSKLRAAAAAAAAANSNSPSGHSIDLNSPRVYAHQPSNYCPVEAYKVYRMRRPNNCLDRDSPFYLAPLFKSKNQSKVWYKALAMSCQRLDALFYCLFKKAGVDLTSLASMSQQQQQQAVAAAASIINNTDQQLSTGAPIITSPSTHHQWKATVPAVKDGQHITDDVNELLNGKHDAHRFSSSNIQHQQTIYTTQQTGANNTSGQHHIITTVPAQVQVQVQVQVQLPQHQQQNNAGNNNSVALLA